MSAWIALALAASLTWVLRAGPSLAGGRLATPAVVERASRYVTPALLGAMAARSLSEQATGDGGPAVMLAVLAALVTSARTRSALPTLAVAAVVHTLATGAMAA